MSCDNFTRTDRVLDDGTNRVTAEEIRNHIDGPGSIHEDNFSYEIISSLIIIPYEQQMIVMQALTIESGGELQVEGTLVLED